MTWVTSYVTQDFDFFEGSCMRADRLLSLTLLLQTRGKMTTAALARELSVSRRTILRDVEALSLAGIPVYCEGGHGGGVALDEHYRTTLTGLQTSEIRTLFVPRDSAVLRDLGLSDAADSLVLKLLAALPAMHRPTVEHIRQRLLIDSTWWWRNIDTPAFWDELQQAVYEDRMIEVAYEHPDGEVVRRVLAPYSLVNKSSLWYLVAWREHELRTYRVARFREVHLLDQTFARITDFDLPTYWRDNQKQFVESLTQYRCVLRVHPERIDFIKWLLPGRWEILGDGDGAAGSTPGAAGWIGLRIMLDSALLAKMLVFGLGRHCEVVEPPDLAQAVLEDARAVSDHLSAPR